jgi:hypothetical protein
LVAVCLHGRARTRVPCGVHRRGDFRYAPLSGVYARSAPRRALSSSTVPGKVFLVRVDNRDTSGTPHVPKPALLLGSSKLVPVPVPVPGW